MADGLLQARDLVRTYRRGGQAVHALRGVGLDLGAGTFVVLRGRSGSGKTTLLNLLGGLDRPDAGAVYVGGRDLTAMSDRELTALRRHQLGFVFQAFSLLPTFSAFENVELALQLAGLGMRARRGRVEEVLASVGLADRARHRPFELSGGEQQRVAIARALANRPALLLADEPTGELDSQTGRAILRLFREAVTRERVTILMATHDPTASEFADVTYYLADGRLGGLPT